MMVVACCVVDLWLCRRDSGRKREIIILIQNVDNHLLDSVEELFMEKSDHMSSQSAKKYEEKSEN